MKDAIGGANLLNIVIFIVSILLILLIGFLSYSKAYKVKNRIVNIINKYEMYDTSNDGSGSNDMLRELNSDLASIGYRVVEFTNCKTGAMPTNSPYNYCVYQKNLDNGSYYYIVETFATIEIPLVEDIFKIPVSGETNIFGINYDY